MHRGDYDNTATVSTASRVNVRKCPQHTYLIVMPGPLDPLAIFLDQYVLDPHRLFFSLALALTPARRDASEQLGRIIAREVDESRLAP